MARYHATLAYDGTVFDGFQIQPGRRTVEGEVQSALRNLGWQGRTLPSGGRTDAGVHAAGQVIAFDLAWRHPTEELHRAFNAGLPADIGCRGLKVVPADFHPRYSAIRRCYRYRLILSEWPDPLEERFALRVWPAPDETVMNAAAELIRGKRDFGAFGTAPRKGSHTVRTVLWAEWTQAEDRMDFRIEADAFLFRMVRIIVGTMLQTGSGRRPPEDWHLPLRTPPEAKAGPAAPAQGLCLVRVEYPEPLIPGVETDLEGSTG
ncbi:MAG: tRNA pseudouridine(38-40) synthase TruA, partial [Dehalococcoidia bacterium]